VPRLFFTNKISIPNPHPTTVAQVRANIDYLTQLKSTGKIDLEWADSFIADQRILHDSLVDEAKLLAANGDTGDLTIRIEGGLPTLPGTDITMPLINGVEVYSAQWLTTRRSFG
jgi:hypothetical protein